MIVTGSIVRCDRCGKEDAVSTEARLGNDYSGPSEFVLKEVRLGGGPIFHWCPNCYRAIRKFAVGVTP